MGSKIGKNKRKAEAVIYNTAVKEVRRQIPRGLDQCYGAMAMIMGYLPRNEQLKLQVLDTWWYAVGVSRVQWRYKLLKVAYFTDDHKDIVAVNELGMCKRFAYEGYNTANFSNEGWVSCQIGKNRLFQAGTECCRMLKINPYQKSFTFEYGLYMPIIQRFLCLVNFKDKFVFNFDNFKPLRYWLTSRKWEEILSCDVVQVSGCTLGDKVYLFGRTFGGPIDTNCVQVLYNPGASISSQAMRW